MFIYNFFYISCTGIYTYQNQGQSFIGAAGFQFDTESIYQVAVCCGVNALG